MDFSEFGPKFRKQMKLSVFARTFLIIVCLLTVCVSLLLLVLFPRLPEFAVLSFEPLSKAPSISQGVATTYWNATVDLKNDNVYPISFRSISVKMLIRGVEVAKAKLLDLTIDSRSSRTIWSEVLVPLYLGKPEMPNLIGECMNFGVVNANVTLSSKIQLYGDIEIAYKMTNPMSMKCNQKSLKSWHDAIMKGLFNSSAE